MGLRKWLNKVLNGLAEVRDAPVFPDLLFCPVCGQRTYWLTVRKLWRCDNFHAFAADAAMVAHFPPPPRMPGDKGDNTDGQI